MPEHSEHRAHDEAERFTDPPDDVKRRNRITGYILLAIIIGLIITGMFVRVYK